jgi:hypothetical protein
LLRILKRERTNPKKSHLEALKDSGLKRQQITTRTRRAILKIVEV